MFELHYTTRISRLYTEPVSFENDEILVGDPISPFVTMKTGGHYIYFRSIIFIDDEFIDPPTVKSCAMGDQDSKEVNQLNIEIDYLSDNQTPTNYNPWMVQIDIDVSNFMVSTIRTVLTNRDPRTSRGTYTIVPKPDQPTPISTPE